MPEADAPERLRFVEVAPGDRWSLYEVVSGPRTGLLVAGAHGLVAGCGGSQTRPYGDLSSAERARADHKAERLLVSLLDDDQRAQWRVLGTFTVSTPFGSVELGRLFDIRHRPAGERRQRSLCVIPSGWERAGRETPPADVWTNLLLLLRHDPAEFFRVANVRSEDVGS